MFNGSLEPIRREFKEHPVTVGLLLAVLLGGVAYGDFRYATKTELWDLSLQVSENEESNRRVQILILNSEISRRDSEIYTLERLIETGQSTERDRRRIIELKRELEDLVLQRNLLLRES